MITIKAKNMSIQQKGFTLVEISIVLIVIGIIIGAVSIGKDLQRNASYMQINNAFIQGWMQAYQSYFERNGFVVGDTSTAPTLKVNASNTERCSSDLYADMDAAGIKMPPGRAEGKEDLFVYLDSNGNPQQLAICFQNVSWSIPGATSGYVLRQKNVMVIKSLTPDLARYLERSIDQIGDARFGSFRESTQAASTSLNSADWSIDNRRAYGDASNSNLDESQIAVLTAYYLMNQ
ncbi:MAG: prepilin-type N-terminal cleavage/methylation domain-containing protein [Pseudomonadota bacterium]